VSTTPASPCAEAEVVIDAGIDQIWNAITSSAQAYRWWGLSDGDLDQVAREVTVQTGSSSFYRLWIDRIAAPRLLEFTSSYLGVTPTTRVRWELEPDAGSAVRVRVAERLQDRQPAALRLAGELWHLRLTMLRHVLEGTPAPGLPPDILLSAELSGPGWRPLHPSNLVGWLPISGPELPPRWFYVIDSEGARPFPVVGWRSHYDDRLGIELQVQPDGPSTRADLSITESFGSVLLTVRHTGWAELPTDAEIRLELRSRFYATWRLAISQGAQRAVQQ